MPRVEIFGNISGEQMEVLHHAIESLPPGSDHLNSVGGIFVLDEMPMGVNAPALALDGDIYLRVDTLDSLLRGPDEFRHEVAHCLDRESGWELSNPDKTPFGMGVLPNQLELNAGEHDDWPSRYAADPSLSPERRAQEDFAECYRVVTGDPDRYLQDLESSFANLAQEYGTDWESQVAVLEFKYLYILRMLGKEPRLP